MGFAADVIPTQDGFWFIALITFISILFDSIIYPLLLSKCEWLFQHLFPSHFSPWSFQVNMDICYCQETTALIALTSLPLIASNLGSKDDSVTFIKSFSIKVLGNVTIMYNSTFAVQWHSGVDPQHFHIFSFSLLRNLFSILWIITIPCAPLQLLHFGPPFT